MGVHPEGEDYDLLWFVGSIGWTVDVDGGGELGEGFEGVGGRGGCGGGHCFAVVVCLFGIELRGLEGERELEGRAGLIVFV